MKSPVTIPALIFCLTTALFAQDVPSPEAVFGFRMGADRKLLHWEQILSYFDMLNRASARLQVEDIGQSTQGRRMIMAIISAEQTLAQLDMFRRIQQQLAQPYGLDEAAAEKLAEQGKTVVLITMNIHANEIAASQGALELAYELATQNDPRTRHILDHTILLMVPSLNPDGQDMVSKWYMRYVGTPHEGTPMPYKYHHYADHDNNRDWFFFNLRESRNVAKVLYHEWYPEIVMDQHQMGSRGARFFLPPYADPVNPNVPPSLMASTNMVGKHIVSDLHDRGFTGLVTNTIFNAYFAGTMSKTPLWHNRIGILTEAASVRYATPVFFPKTSLRGMGQDLPEYKQQTNFLDPWPGGWWRLRDIVEYQKAAALSLLDLTATFKAKFKRNFYELNRRAMESGRTESPAAYVVPADQHDPNSAVEMLRRLRIANVAIYRAREDFATPAGRFRAGDFVIPLAQPARAWVRDLMERQHYPDLREYPGGPPRQPYDVTAWTLPLMMGVDAVAVPQPLSVPLEALETPRLVPDIAAVPDGWLGFERRFINSYKLANALLKRKIALQQLSEPLAGLPAGSFAVWATEKNRDTLQNLAAEAGVPWHPLPASGNNQTLPARQIRAARIGIYQPWIPWAYDEGWLRLVLDEFGFEYQVLHNADFSGKTDLKNFDVIIFGSQETEQIVDGRKKPEQLGEPDIPAEYRGGIGQSGIQRVREFLLGGGTALFFGAACNFALEKLHLPGNNPLKNLKRKDFFVPGSILEMQLNPESPLSYGMKNPAAIYLNNSVALALEPYPAEIRESGFYGDHQVLQSGWAVGQPHLHGRVALAEIPVGAGQVVLYAFRPQHRGQMYGTFRLIFNALYD